MRALIDELRAQLAQLEQPLPTQEGVWKGIKKAADTAVSAVPVAGGVYNAAKAANSFNKAAGTGVVGAAQWVTGHKKAAAKSFQQAKTAGADAVSSGASAATTLVPGGTVAKLVANPLVHAGIGAAQQAVTVPTTKKKKPVPFVAKESVLFPSTRALVEFRSLVGLSPVRG